MPQAVSGYSGDGCVHLSLLMCVGQEMTQGVVIMKRVSSECICVNRQQNS